MPAESGTGWHAVDAHPNIHYIRGDTGGTPVSRRCPIPRRTSKKLLTPWHPLEFSTLRDFTPEGYEALEEFYLNHHPQRIDTLLIQKVGQQRGPLEGLDAILRYLKRYMTIELKGPHDGLEGSDLTNILGYGYQLLTLRNHDRLDDVTLVTLSDGISGAFLERVERLAGQVVEVAPGTLEIYGFGFELVAIDAGPASQRAGNHLLYLFTKAFLADPTKVLPLLSARERETFLHVCQRVIQFTGREFVKREEYIEMREGLDKAWSDFLKHVPVQKRLEGLTAEEVLSQYKPEEVLRQYKPEEVLRQYGPEEVLQALDAETKDRLKKLLQ